ncbi:hypothetical protein AB0H77_21985 [Streptomyces sp. NPDC050844]|uniref:hypothetical protein n=1 Tax=Streptomyces sp. NPDC050844 TaxID=3155790 RepID=UPI0033C39BFC
MAMDYPHYDIQAVGPYGPDGRVRISITGAEYVRLDEAELIAAVRAHLTSIPDVTGTTVARVEITNTTLA